jgi:hypothetical protein
MTVYSLQSRESGNFLVSESRNPQNCCSTGTSVLTFYSLPTQNDNQFGFVSWSRNRFATVHANSPQPKISTFFVIFSFREMELFFLYSFLSLNIVSFLSVSRFLKYFSFRFKSFRFVSEKIPLIPFRFVFNPWFKQNQPKSEK